MVVFIIVNSFVGRILACVIGDYALVSHECSGLFSVKVIDTFYLLFSVQLLSLSKVYCH